MDDREREEGKADGREEKKEKKGGNGKEMK